jgi:hypothetical protein
MIDYTQDTLESLFLIYFWRYQAFAISVSGCSKCTFSRLDLLTDTDF